MLNIMIQKFLFAMLLAINMPCTLAYSLQPASVASEKGQETVMNPETR